MVETWATPSSTIARKSKTTAWFRRRERSNQTMALEVANGTVVQQSGQSSLDSLSLDRSYDWAGLRTSRGLIPRALRRSNQSHLRRSHCRTTGDQPMSSLTVRIPEPALATPTPVRPIIYLGMDVHKDSITIAVLPALAKAPTRLEKAARVDHQSREQSLTPPIRSSSRRRRSARARSRNACCRWSPRRARCAARRR